jgi:hypothetical protein
MKMCIELGLHRRRSLKKISLKSELRKRLFWSCYYWDREISIAMGRPFSISDHDIDVEVWNYVQVLEMNGIDNPIASTGRRRSEPRCRSLEKGCRP